MESSGHMTGWTLGALPETGNVGEGRRRVWGKREMSSDTLSETDLGPPRGGLGVPPWSVAARGCSIRVRWRTPWSEPWS